MHAFATSKLLTSVKDKEAAILEVYLIFAYRTMAGRVSHYFKFDLDKSVAIAVHERLSNKFLIKKLGTWQAVFEYKANSIMLKGGLHSERIVRYTDDDVMRIIIDLQGSIRDIVKNIYTVLIYVRENNLKVSETSLETITDDGAAIKDITNRQDIYLKYIKSIIFSKNDFIKYDLVHLVNDITNNIGNKDLPTILEYLSDNYLTENKVIKPIIDTAIVNAITYISKSKSENEYSDDIGDILIMLKNYYAGSRVEDKKLDKVKKEIFKIYVKVTGKHSKVAMSSTRIGILIYIFLRAVAMNAYK